MPTEDVQPHSLKPIEMAHVESTSKYLQFVKLTEHALTPTRKSPRSAGFTLRSPYDTTVPARGKELIRRDLQIKLPEGCYGRISPITDLALFHHLSIGAGVIDEVFRGNLSVLLFNHSENHYIVSRGDKIATLVYEKIYFAELDLLEKLDDAWSGASGFGSTGQN